MQLIRAVLHQSHPSLERPLKPTPGVGPLAEREIALMRQALMNNEAMLKRELPFVKKGRSC